jgi:hypothetical protein
LTFHFTPVRTTLTKEEKTVNSGEDMQKGALTHYWWDFKLVKELWKSLQK